MGRGTCVTCIRAMGLMHARDPVLYLQLFEMDLRVITLGQFVLQQCLHLERGYWKRIFCRFEPIVLQYVASSDDGCISSSVAASCGNGTADPRVP
jgi:hypothetical protein